MLKEGHVIPISILIIVWIYGYFLLKKAKTTGKHPPIRKIPALDHIYELVGRCAELGRPLLLSPSDGATLRGAEAAETHAAISIMNHAVKLCAKMSVRPITVLGSKNAAETYPLIVENIREAYISEGQEDDFNVDDILFISGEQMSFAAGTMGVVIRENVASQILIGPWHGSYQPISLAGIEAGAMQIAGTSRVTMMPVFVAFSDYVLLGEEVFVSGAYLSDEPGKKAMIAAQDFGKYIAMIALLLGSFLMYMGFSTVYDILVL